MPRRSNKFQALVLRIYAAMESVHGAKVEESVLLPEEHADSRREVDVLVTRLVGGRSMRIAIEARDHDRGQDITWVDSLIGKYHDLGVNAVIAISHSPFTRTAEQKAIHHRIQLLELREAESVDWAAALARSGSPQFLRLSTPTHVRWRVLERSGDLRCPSNFAFQSAVLMPPLSADLPAC